MPRKTPNEDRHTPVRKCILSGERAEQSLLIRLALGPDGTVAPDIMGKAPGRGAWIGVPAEELSLALAKGKLAGMLKRAFKAEKVSVPDDLAERVRKGLAKATLDRLGLEARASNLLTGAEKVDQAARSGAVEMLLHAADAATMACRKRDQSWRVGDGCRKAAAWREYACRWTATTLSAALGRGNAVHVAITDVKAAERVNRHLERWLYFIGCSNAPGDRATAAASVRDPASATTNE